MFIFATVAAAGFNVVREDAKVSRSGVEIMAFSCLSATPPSFFWQFGQFTVS